jgi:DNA-directed RNA polymerase subunit M/transcription elongation factor TFIIS
MGLVQKIFKAILPASTLASMEAESRKWMVKCNTCGTERSIWEMGGVRSGASGTKTTRVRCEKCGKNEWHTIYFAG